MQKLKSSLNEWLQSKYPHLELAVLPLSEVNKDNESKRIDSEYFKKEYLEIDTLLDKLTPTYLDIKNIVSGPFGSTLTSESYITEGIDFIRVTDIKGGFFIDKENIVKISEYDNQKIKKSELICGDFVVSKVGNSIGYVAQLQDDIKKCNISENNIGIKMRGFDECYKKYILVFLNSKYGQLQIWRRVSGNAQPKINVNDFAKIKIPILPKDFQLEIEKLVKDSHKALEDSKTFYKEAEELLYESLGLDSKNPLESLHRSQSSLRGSEATEAIHKSKMDCHDSTLRAESRNDNVYCHTERSEVFKNTNADLVDTSAFSKPQYDRVLDCHADKSARNDDKDSPSFACGSLSCSPSLAEGARGWVEKYPHLNISIRTLSQSYGKSGRLDSEYYQSKYDTIERKIKDYKGGYCRLQDLILSYSGGFAFSSDDYLESGDLALIRINNIKNANLDMSNAVYLKSNARDLSPKDKVKRGDILISMSGSIGLSCLIRENIEAMINQRILKISIKDFSGDVLVLLLNSIFCKLQFERVGTGGVQTNISSSDILNILIPKIDSTVQEQIASKIQKSFALRKEAKDLLESAKSKVQNAIEQV